MKKIYFLLLALCILYNVTGQNPSDRNPNFNLFDLPINHYFVGNDVTKSTVLQDGKILVLEDKKRLIRLDGNLFDNTFYTGKGFFANYNPDLINDFAVQSDGKVIVGGNFTSYNDVNKGKLIRLNIDGSIDSNFNVDYSILTSKVLKIIILSDGRIFINTIENGFYKMRILNSDGSAGFSYVVPSDYIYQGFAFQNDGKLIISRRGTSFLNFSYSCDVVRLNVDGSVDSSFNAFNLGSYYTPYGNKVSEIKKVVIQQDGKLLVAGYFPGCLMRLNSDGSKDVSFKANGGFRISSGYFASINDFAIQKDSKIIVGGSFDSFNYNNASNVLRLSQEGDLDPDFFDTGVFSNIGITNSVSLFGDDKILVSGELRSDGIGDKQNNYILKLNADGSKDNSFNNVCKGFFGAYTNNLIFKVVETKDNKILVGGNFISYNGVKAHNFLRLNKDGSLDDTFNLEKFDIFRGINNSVSAVLPLPDGKIILGAFFSKLNSTMSKCIIKLNEDGSIDSIFEKNSGNGFTIDGIKEGYISAMLLLQDNSILVGGTFNTYDGTKCSNAVILDSEGKYKRSLWLNNSIIDLKSQNNGKSLVVIKTNIYRYNNDFTLDNTFILDPKITNVAIKSIDNQLDGKILIAGDFTINGLSVNLIRISSDGALDDLFKLGRQNINFENFTVLLDQKIIVSYVDKNTYKSYIERFNNDGSIDSLFNKQIMDSGYYMYLYSQNNGGVLLYGNFINYQDKSSRGLVSLLGEDYNFVIGQNKYDLTNNGCDISDPILKNLKMSVFSNANSFDYISNDKGNYSVGLPNGTHKITPILENPTYFNISPTTLNVTFPPETSPFTQNFCITPNGVRPDLEVTLLQLQPARPGFDAKYKLVYKNKGNTIQSGSVNLTFNDAILDLVLANPVTTTQTSNNLSWNFTNLKPFETREITFTMNVNSPQETPAVNNGTILNFTTTIASAATDENQIDNTFAFNQTVVGSYDPNDKTCLEGSVITPALIGQYVHYLIRFENTGTFAATNVVVKDMIDLSKFDISTLIPTSASHSYTARISEGNKVEFIFENINLPFDDANNDGYIAFKIKTKPTLVVNDSFTNEANIYFDYNFPILTNKATSTFKTLGTTDFDFARYFTLYPNPAKADLNITAKETLTVKSISVYNTLGQLVLVVTNADKVSKIDVSRLTAGNYFIKINSDRGTSNARFIKE